MFLQLVASGLAQGSIYALAALGMTVLFRATTIVDFGHGELFMLGALSSTLLVQMAGLSFPVAGLAAVIFMFAVGLVIERLLIRPLDHRSHMSMTMMTVAFSFLFKGVARYFYGRDVLAMPPVFAYPPIEVGGVVVTVQDIVISAVTLGLVGVFLAVFRFSRFGRIAQAASQSPRGAALIGINLPRLHGAMWGVSAALGAIAGILTAPISLVYPDMGGSVLMRAFAAMTLGGFGHFGGAVLGGLLVGVFEQLAGGYISSSVIDIFAYLIIVVVLLVAPSGLFGRRETVRV